MAYNLPYPNIVFVPLDVLTAEELNQIVANTEGLASQITSASRTINVIPSRYNTSGLCPVGNNVIQ